MCHCVVWHCSIVFFYTVPPFWIYNTRSAGAGSGTKPIAWHRVLGYRRPRIYKKKLNMASAQFYWIHTFDARSRAHCEYHSNPIRVRWLVVQSYVMAIHLTRRTVHGLGSFVLLLPRIWLSLMDWSIPLECFYPCSWIILKKAGKIQVKCFILK